MCTCRELTIFASVFVQSKKPKLIQLAFIMNKNCFSAKWWLYLVTAWALLALPRGVTAQEVDFSGKLSEAAPADGFTLQTGDYQTALSDGGWTVLLSNPNLKWKSTFKSEYFTNEVSSKFGNKDPYHSYLISPAIDLTALSGGLLNFQASAGTVKGSAPLKVSVIDKAGATLAALGTITPVAGSKVSDYAPYAYPLPALSGVGFIAFEVQGDLSNTAIFQIKGLSLQKSSGVKVQISATPESLSFDVVNVGEVSVSKSIALLIANYTGSVTASLGGDHPGDFLLSGTEGLTQTGGTLNVSFAPTASGTRKATLTVKAGEESLSIPLTGEALGSVVPQREEGVELLQDPYLYEFDAANRPTRWEVKGSPSKLEGLDSYHSDTGFGLGLITDAAGGYLRQTISLKTDSYEVVAGDELEAQLHYYTAEWDEAALPAGPFRLACRYLNAAGDPVASAEQPLMNNPTLYFGRRKAWGTFKFRTIVPQDAVKLEFAVEVAPNASVRLDDLGCYLLATDEQLPFAAILPQYRTFYSKTGETQSMTVAVQGFHLSAEQEVFPSGPDKAITGLPATLAKGNSTVSALMNFTPTTKGFRPMGQKDAYSVSLTTGTAATDPERSVLNITAYVADSEHMPEVKLQNAPQEMTAEPGLQTEQTLTFTVNNVITDVTVALEQETAGVFRTSTGLFYYGKSADKVLNSDVRITFAPRTEGTFKATLRLTTPLADTLEIPIVGTAKRLNGEWLAETFAADNALDSRFIGKPEWTNYHKFDRGYWYLDGKWNQASDVTLSADGKLYFDEVIATGVQKISVEPAQAAARLKAQYSLDGGGRWSDAPAAQDGTFTFTAPRPTYIRLVNTGSEAVTLNKVSILPFPQEERQAMTTLAEAILADDTTEPLPLLNERFNTLRHTRALGLAGWQNLMVEGERPFYAWEQKDATGETVQERCAQISFLKYGVTDNRPHQTWLVSPVLSWREAKSHVLTFRLRYELPTTDAGETFSVNVVTLKEGKPFIQSLALTDFLPEGVDFVPNRWFDCYIDLEALNLVVEERFYIAFAYQADAGGNATSLTFMLDDVTFGRTDLPVLSVDKKLLNFLFTPKIQTPEQTLSVTAANATDVVTLTLNSAAADNGFILSDTQLPKGGGVVSLSYKSDKSQSQANLLLIQTRGAKTVTVKLLAQLEGAVEWPLQEQITLYPNPATERVHIAVPDLSVAVLYNAGGEAVRLFVGADAAADAYVGDLPRGRYLLHVQTHQGASATQSLMLK